MSECKCNLRTRLVGDGCERCNPQMAIDILKERLEELRAAADQADEEYRAEIARLRPTDEEREAIEKAIGRELDAEWYGGKEPDRVVALRGLLERTK